MQNDLVYVDFFLNEVENYEDFHDYSAQVFGFPSSYGRNMNAWVDCVRSVSFPEEMMTTLTIAEDQILVLVIHGLEGLLQRNPQLANSFLFMLGFANNLHYEKFNKIVLSYVVRS